MTAKVHLSTLTLVAGAAALASSTLGCHTSEAKAQTAPKPEPTIKVTSAAVTLRTVPRTLGVTGSLSANRESNVAATVAGRVVAVHGERGEVVEQGALLARLDARDAALQRAEADAHVNGARIAQESANRDCTRAEQLLQNRVISQAEYDRTRASCDAAAFSQAANVARKRLAERALGDSAVRAPFAGVVAERVVEDGEFVMPGQTVARLVEINPLRLELSIPESAAGIVHRGSPVSFMVAAFPGQPFAGVVAHLGPVVRQAGRDFVVEALVDNAAGKLRPGMFATAELELGTRQVLTVPQKAISGSPSSPRLFVVHDGRAEERVLKLLGASGDLALVDKGVRENEQVIVAASSAYSDGSRVE